MRISDNAAVEKILKAVSDGENAKIMSVIRKEPKSAQMLCSETGIPLSTVYRKLDELREAGLIMTEHFVISSGKRIDLVIVTFSELRMVVEQGRFVIDITPSDETANIKWLSLFRGE